MAKKETFFQGIKSFVAWEWISSVTKSLFKLASYIVELPMVASGVYIMIATGIPGAENVGWYNLAFGVLLSAPEVLAPGAFFRAETMQSRGKIHAARVTRWIASAMLVFAALTFSSVMIFHFPEQWLQAIMFCRVMTALGYSIITRIDMDHGAIAPVPPAQQIDAWSFVAWASQIEATLATLQSDVQQQISELASKHQSALVNLVSEDRLAEAFDVHIHKFNLVDLQMQQILHDLQTLQSVETVTPTIDYDVLKQAVLSHFQAQFEAFLSERVSVSPVSETPQISAPEESKTPVSKQSKRSVKTGTTEIVRRSRKVSDEEVDAVVHPLLEKDHTLTHRKIAPTIGLPETTVYKSLKRWRDNQPIVSGELETVGSKQSETVG